MLRLRSGQKANLALLQKRSASSSPSSGYLLSLVFVRITAPYREWVCISPETCSAQVLTRVGHVTWFISR